MPIDVNFGLIWKNSTKLGYLCLIWQNLAKLNFLG
jgi:hypothetical protein